MEDIRKLLTTYAHNILGSYEDAKDIVQDAYLKFSNIDNDDIENKKAYLVRTPGERPHIILRKKGLHLVLLKR